MSAPRRVMCSYCREHGHTRRNCPTASAEWEAERLRRDAAIGAFAEAMAPYPVDVRKHMVMRAWDAVADCRWRRDLKDSKAASSEIEAFIAGDTVARVRYHQDALVLLDEEQEEARAA